MRALLGRLGLRPTKQRGQNFVTDPNTIRRIVRAADVGPAETVLEIGPGLGSLTLGLLEATPNGRVVAVEVDPTLAAALADTITTYAGSAASRLTVLADDALGLRGPDHLGVAPDVVVANLPYNVAVPVLLRVLERFPSLRGGLVLVQLEVADRLAAAPGSKNYGVPSVKLAWYAEARRVGLVGRTVFWPQPRVDSGLVTFHRRSPPGDGAVARERVFTLVDAAFAQRRKTLRAALSGLAGSASAAEMRIRAAGIEPTTRGERLEIGDFVRLTETFAAYETINAEDTHETEPDARQAGATSGGSDAANGGPIAGAGPTEGSGGDASPNEGSSGSAGRGGDGGVHGGVAS